MEQTGIVCLVKGSIKFKPQPWSYIRNTSSESNQLIELSSSLMEIQEMENKLKETMVKFRMYNLIKQ